MKIVLACLVAIASAAIEPGFALLPAAKCNDAVDGRQCAVAGPKEWSSDERRAMEDTMRRLIANELVRGILVSVQENGYNGFSRYATSTKLDPKFGQVAMFSPGFVVHVSKTIGITDAFFQTESVRDPISDYRYGDVILIHELVHAFDDRRRSADAQFRSVTGWMSKNDRWHYSNPVDRVEYHQVFADTLTFYSQGRHSDAWQRDRAFATSMAFPLPTIQSLVNPEESFADILAHLIVDPKASTYLKSEVIDWFAATVFPVLRENARRFNGSV